jgi:hypothetical protein
MKVHLGPLSNVLARWFSLPQSLVFYKTVMNQTRTKLCVIHSDD